MVARTVVGFLVLILAVAPAVAADDGIERDLSSVYSNCGRMIRLQRELQKAAGEVERTISSRPDRKPTSADREQFRALATRQRVIIGETDRVIARLEKEGTAVAFTEIFIELRDQMKKVEARFDMGDLGDGTRRIEKEIVDTLQEMIAAVRRPNDV